MRLPFQLRGIASNCKFKGGHIDSRLQREVAAVVVPIQLVRTLRRVAAKEKPDVAHSLQELFITMTGAQITGINRTQDDEPLISIRLERFNCVLITSRRQLDLLLTTTMIQADAIYKVLPVDLCTQLFTVHASWDGHVRAH